MAIQLKLLYMGERCTGSHYGSNYDNGTPNETNCYLATQENPRGALISPLKIHCKTIHVSEPIRLSSLNLVWRWAQSKLA